LGGIAEFLDQYVKEFIYYGHDKSSIEIEAKTLKTKLKERWNHKFICTNYVLLYLIIGLLITMLFEYVFEVIDKKNEETKVYGYLERLLLIVFWVVNIFQIIHDRTKRD
jgi:hypothetical protein